MIESLWEYRCSLSCLLCVVQVAATARGWSLVQRSPPYNPMELGSIGLSHVWTTTRSLARKNICQWWWMKWRTQTYVASITAQNFLRKWDQRACEPLYNMYLKWGGGRITSRNVTLWACHRLSNTKRLINSLHFFHSASQILLCQNTAQVYEVYNLQTAALIPDVTIKHFMTLQMVGLVSYPPL